MKRYFNSYSSLGMVLDTPKPELGINGTPIYVQLAWTLKDLYFKVHQPVLISDKNPYIKSLPSTKFLLQVMATF